METIKTKIISMISIFAVALVVITATFAYFHADVDDLTAVDISVNVHTVDTFTFSTGDPVTVSLDQENFASGKENLSGTTTATATLTANNDTNTATEHYYMYLNIKSNSFIYSIDESTPEIILTVTDSSGSLVSISGLTSVTADGVTGYDITNKSGLIKIFDNREITTTSSIEEKWNVVITFINYDKNQTANAGKSMNAEVIIQKEKVTLSAPYLCKNGQSLSSCIVILSDYDDTLYYHNSTLTNGAGDDSYRYAGASSAVNNYVCFGTDAETCPTDNLYRIIGVIDGKVKLIKATSLVNKAWDSGGANTWSTSSLYTYLNETYLETFSEDWQAKIATTTWKVGGISDPNVTATTMYTNEMNSASTGTDSLTESSSKIALMYAHDYGFAASPTAWATNLYAYDGNDTAGTSIKTNNWLHLSLVENILTRNSSSGSQSYRINSGGSVRSYGAVSYSSENRPVFFLESTVAYLGGVGSSDDPIKIQG